MGLELTREDVRWLRSAAGRDALELTAGWELTPSSLLRDVDAARGVAGDRGAVLLETARLRRRAVDRKSVV